MKRAVLLAACACVAFAAVALAQPKPLLPADASKVPPKFPMSSDKFRPLFEKTVQQMQSLLSKAPDGAARAEGIGKIERAKFRASLATQDGVVTADEAMGIWRDN